MSTKLLTVPGFPEYFRLNCPTVTRQENGEDGVAVAARAVHVESSESDGSLRRSVDMPQTTVALREGHPR